MLIGDNSYRNVSLVMCKKLSKEDEEEMYKALRYVEGKFGVDVFNQLKAIKVQRIKDTFIKGKHYRHGGTYIHNERSIIINVTYFNSDADKETTNKVVGKFRRIFMHQIANYLFNTKNLLRVMLKGTSSARPFIKLWRTCSDTIKRTCYEVRKVYIDSEEYIEKRYNSGYIKALKSAIKLSEIFALAFCDFCEGTLDNKYNNKSNSLFDFIQSLEVQNG